MNATSRLILVRHGTCARLDEMLLGRTVDAPLDSRGVTQAQAVAEHLRNVNDPVLECSPRRRARETAERIAQQLNVEPQIAAALDELDFGPWSGRSFADLEHDPRWKYWNARRGEACTPAGESIAAVHDRVSSHLDELRREHPRATFILVTHAEVIRTLVMYWLGVPTDSFLQVPIAPASITTIAFDSDGARVQELNVQVAA
ncbi:MAG: histidine phosphatase family protein [Povalibacter sp.]